MTWDYLPDLDERLHVVAEFLRGRTGDRVIVDVNCLEARLLRYINADYRRYIGNDLQDRFPLSYPRTEFHRVPDDDFAYMVDECDILLVLGGCPKGKCKLESQTLMESVSEIIDRTHPGIVVVETVEQYVHGCDLLRSEYPIAVDRKLDLGDAWTHKRRVRIYERAHEEATT